MTDERLQECLRVGHWWLRITVVDESGYTDICRRCGWTGDVVPLPKRDTPESSDG